MEGSSRAVRIAGSCLLASGLLFLLLNTIAEGLYTNYSVATNALSDLGATTASTSLLWNGQLFISGVLLLLGMYLLFSRSDWGSSIVKRRSLVGALYILPGIGVILVSLFPENTILVIHGIGAIIVFILGAIGCLYAYRLVQSPYRYFSVALGIVSLVSIPLSFASNPSVSGLMERLIVYPYNLWLVGFGSYLVSFQAK
jgi:hypothetical membrane protein